MGLIYLRTGLAAYSSINFCLFWTFCTCCLDVTGLLLMAFASFERYLFIFHSMFLQQHQIILRYIPICLCFIYPFFYFIGIIYILPCSHEFYYSAYLCGGGCYLYDPVWNAITWLVNVCTPVFIILLLNILLIIRILYQKNRMQQRNVWLKNRKMLIQLVSIALLYCLAWLPNAILILIVTFPPSNVNTPRIFIIFQHTIFLTGFTPLFYPFVCLFGQPVILKKIKQIFQRHDLVTPIRQLSYRNNINK
jgi:hypothetical protein